MMKKIILVGLLLVTMFLIVGCAVEKAVPQETFEEGSIEEEMATEEGEEEESTGLVGHGFAASLSPGEYITYLFDNDDVRNEGMENRPAAVVGSGASITDGVITFDGTVNGFIAQTGINYFPYDAISVMLDIKRTSAKAVGLVSYAVGNGGWSANEFLLWLGADGRINVVVDRNGKGVYQSGYLDTNLPLNEMHNLVVTWQSSGGIVRAYVDGVLAGEKTGVATGRHISELQGSLVLGQDQDRKYPTKLRGVDGGFQASQAFVGEMDNVRIFNYVIDEDQMPGRGGAEAEEVAVDEVEKVYKEVYYLYKANKFEEVISKISKYVAKVPGSTLVPKFELLKAFAIGKYQDPQAYKIALDFVAVSYGSTEEGKKAKAILKQLEK